MTPTKITPAKIFPKSLRERDATVAGTETKWSHPTKTLIHFSMKLFPLKWNKYPFNIPHTQEYLIAIPKKVITVIQARTRVVLRSLFIGLMYSKIFGEIEDQAQSITNPKRFPKRIIKKNPAISEKNALANPLSPWNDSVRFWSNKPKICKIAVFSFDESCFKALFAKKAKIITKIKNTKVATLVLLMGPYTVSHWIFGICGPEWCTSVCNSLFWISVIYFLFSNDNKLFLCLWNF